MSSLLPSTQTLVESGWLPDWLVRAGIRRLLRRRLAEHATLSSAAGRAERQALLETMRAGPVAVDTQAANRQHYALPPAFFEQVLGPRLKYSACLWEPGVTDLAAAETAMLALCAERAGVQDGQHVLELGCGWGSFSLFVLERFPSCRVTAVSNSAPQRRFVQERARAAGVDARLTVITADMNDFTTEQRFERVVSIEMFEHMRNWERLLDRIAGWLAPEGRLFLHVFAHRELAYLFGTERDDDWLGREFFTGGLMPADDLLADCRSVLTCVRHWPVSGLHYAATARAWLARLDARADAVRPVLAEVHGRDGAPAALARWRTFLMACEELWAFRDGQEWRVAHYLLAPRGDG